MIFGFVRETEEKAIAAGLDISGIPRTGLDTYLKYIFPGTTDWVHDKAFPGKRIRPDYRSDSLKLIVEFDGIPHFDCKSKVDKDIENELVYSNAGYKVVRIPFYINLTTSAINKLFNLQLTETFFSKDISPFTEIKPNYFCLSGLNRLVSDYKKYAPEQIDTMLASIQDSCPLEYQYLSNLFSK